MEALDCGSNDCATDEDCPGHGCFCDVDGDPAICWPRYGSPPRASRFCGRWSYLGGRRRRERRAGPATASGLRSVCVRRTNRSRAQVGATPGRRSRFLRPWLGSRSPARQARRGTGMPFIGAVARNAARPLFLSSFSNAHCRHGPGITSPLLVLHSPRWLSTRSSKRLRPGNRRRPSCHNWSSPAAKT